MPSEVIQDVAAFGDAECSTLVEILRKRGSVEADRRAYTFLVDGDRQEAHLTYGELDLRARSLATELQRVVSREGAAGERALLLYPPGLDYVVGFFGCLYAGVVAVPIYPPDPGRLARTIPRLRAVCADARASVVLTTSEIFAMKEFLFAEAPELASLRWVATDALPALAPGDDAWRDPGATADTVAFLQYTSGSTSTPKGVILTHRNLLHNLSLIHGCFGVTRDTVGVIWLPPYHDMGLIGGVLQPLYAGIYTVLLSPVDFLRRPMRWLEAISRYRGTCSGGPNFAFDLCVRKSTPAQRAALDLSAWDLAFDGAEPIHRETLDRFCEAFGPSGFRREAFYPCYGLAEGTLIASGGEKRLVPVERTFDADALRKNHATAVAGDHPSARTLVGVGTELRDQRIVIVDAATGAPQPDRAIGEIWLSGPSIATGYWNRDDETAAAFHGRLAGHDDATRFLRTGDLGFLDRGELFVTGRLKDLIIVRGRNHYPQDIERTAEASHSALRPGCGAAFAIEPSGPTRDAHDERVVIAHEVDRGAVDAGADLAAIAEGIRRVVTEQHEVSVYGVVLLRAGSLPKTSSGKVQRRECRAGFLEKSLDAVYESFLDAAPAALAHAAPVRERSFIQKALAAMVDPAARRALLELHLQEQAAIALRLPVSRVDLDKPLYALGLDSLGAIDLKSEIDAGLGIDVPVNEIIQGPTLRELARVIEEQGAAAPVARDAGADDAAATGDAPLTLGQQALWFLHRLAPDSAAYHVPVAVRVRAALDVGALQRSFATLVQRHAALRTTFPVPDGAEQPVPRVLADATLDFHVHDATGQTEAALHETVTIESRRPFDLENGPLFRVHLFTRAADDHVLLMVMHHIVTDFWSVALLAGELDVLYPAEVAKTPAQLPSIGATFAGHARAEHEALHGPRGEALAAYWKDALADLPSLGLATDRRRPPVQTFDGDVLAVRMGGGLVASLSDLARSRGVTLNAVVQTAFQALLHRYTGQTDFPIGIVSAGRGRSEVARVAGYCANPLVLRAKPSPSQTFEHFLDASHKVLLGALAHEDLPFNALVEIAKPPRDNSRSPLFQVMFVYQRAQRRGEHDLTPFGLDVAGARAELAGLPIESVSLEQKAAQFDLTLTMGDAAGDLVASFQYSTALFDRATIARMAEHFENLLRGVVRAPSTRLEELPLLSADETQQLLVAWAGERVALPSRETVSTMFAAQARRTPDLVAAVFGDRAITYRDLDRRVDGLAAHLAARGARCGSMIALCLERSIEMVVASLAVLRTGAAYVPIEPTYPAERVAFILDDAGATIAVTQPGLRNRVGSRVEVIVVDDAIAEHDGAAFAAPTSDASDAACLIYTSGSTGQPKGVVLEHGGLVNLVLSFIHSYRPDASDRILPLTSVASASFVGELLPLLCVGGTLVLPSEEEILDLDRLLSLVERRKVTIVSTVPALLVGLDARSDDLPSLRLVLSGGEALVPRDVARLVARSTAGDGGAARVQVVNGYGLTETTVCSTFFTVTGEDLSERAWMPIGRPVLNTDVYVLDASLRCLPIGCAGELFIGGAGLARGYHRRPDLTSERFIANPFRAGERMYRTGDVARWLANGCLEYLHRRDDQVKIRGHRVELGEIEVAIREDAGVRDAFVTTREDTPGDRRVVAYVVAGEAGRTTSDLHASLATKLPYHMIPSAFVFLGALPLNKNGKVDARALPAPEGERPELAAAYAAPQSEIERRIAAIWQRALGVAEVGLNDNFFELGGNSLLIAQVHRRLREDLSADFPLVEMFTLSTVSALARRISTLGSAPAAPDTKIRDEGDKRRAALRKRQEAAQTRGRRPPK